MPHVAQRGDAFEMHYMSGTGLAAPRRPVRPAIPDQAGPFVGWDTLDDRCRIAVGFADAAETALPALGHPPRRRPSHVLCRRGSRDSEGRSEDPIGSVRAVGGRSDLSGRTTAAVREPAPIGRVGRRDASYPCVVRAGRAFPVLQRRWFGQTGFGFAGS